MSIVFLGPTLGDRAVQESSVLQARQQRKSLRCTYRFNTKAWMNTSSIEEWLEWFNRRMVSWNVLLLLNNFCAHECALNSLELNNIRVEYLPLNTTSFWQPCNQGIIYALKGHYRLHFTLWCLEIWEQGKGPLSEVNLLMAVCWVVDAWESDVKRSTLANCVRKGKVLPLEDRQVTAGEQVTGYKEDDEEEIEADVEDAFTS